MKEAGSGVGVPETPGKESLSVTQNEIQRLVDLGYTELFCIPEVHQCSSRFVTVFLDQGLNPCPLIRQVDSLPLHHLGSPRCGLLIPSFWWKSRG